MAIPEEIVKAVPKFDDQNKSAVHALKDVIENNNYHYTKMDARAALAYIKELGGDV